MIHSLRSDSAMYCYFSVVFCAHLVALPVKANLVSEDGVSYALPAPVWSQGTPTAVQELSHY